MTNLLATIIVSIVTNVYVPTTEVPHYWIESKPIILNTTTWTYPFSLETRTEVTEVVEITEVRFTLNGEPWSVKKEKVLSRKERRQVKKEVWEDAQ
jgi:hypothetical protein